MPCKPLELLDIARHLIGHDAGGEAACRGAASRAYYAALHEVQNTFPERAAEYRVDGESTHIEVINRAVVHSKQNLPGRTSAAEIAALMPRLRKMRNRADYRLDEGFAARDGQELVAKATKVLELCSNIEKLRKVQQA